MKLTALTTQTQQLMITLRPQEKMVTTINIEENSYSDCNWTSNEF
jgi:hypothetical protein